jgi:opacity protein-like surface antigen
MRLSPRIFATAAVAVLLMPTPLLRAAEAAKPAVNNKKVIDSSVSSAPEPASSVVADSQPMVTPYVQGRNFGTPRFELFLGYSYLRSVPTLATGNRMAWLNGGSTSIALNLNSYLGLVGDFGGFADSRLLLSGTGGNPSNVVDSSGRAYTYLIGPRVSFRNHTRLTPFVLALFGGIHAGEVTRSGCSGAGCTPLPSENKFALTGGGWTSESTDISPYALFKPSI